ncbi:FAD-dependent oxidoreductase [Aquimarina aggregata]|uniref:FAD-dependent oxidoreductase n=1 Tax=Aquimarina aggregata TaxID=1642818 RepID=UPI002492629A|nr:FAD-dependent oxidoreductase [Aquimarina aggregata]
MKTDYDIIIIGGGAMGLSTAAELSTSGKKTLVLEQFGFFNDKGSSAGLSRQFRVQYAQKYMAQLALDSIPYWDKLQKSTKDILIDKVGSLWFGDPSISSQEGGIQAAIDVMKELKIPFTELTAKEIEKDFPFKDLPKDYFGFFQEDGGIIDLGATLRTLFNIANSSKNIELKEYEKVTDIQSKNDGIITVSTANESFSTEKLIITPGAYINDILKHFGLSVNVDIWEMSSAYYKKTEDIKLPTWFVFQEPQNTSLFYGFPEVNWANPGYIRVAPDIPDAILKDPSQRSGKPSEKSLQLNSNWVKEHMIGLNDQAEFTSTCLITLNNNNKELMIDTLPEWVHNHKNIIVYTGGWAAKFIPLLGKILADLAVTGTTEFDISPFKIQWPVVRGEISNRLLTTQRENLKLDVAIVGAGASGLYSGYRLLNGTDKNGNKLNLDVGIFDLSDRIGGRLESIKLPGMNVVGELGGMRYMTEQKIVTALIEDVFSTQYALKPIDFPMGDANHHLFYLRKQRFFANRFSQAKITGEHFETRYFVEDKFKGKSSDDIFTEIISEVLEADGYSLKQIQESPYAREVWNEVKQKLVYRFPGPYENMLVYKIGFWNLLKDRSSQECYEFLAQAGGYYSNTINWNAAEAFPYMVGDFASDAVKYKTIEGGYDQVLTCLADDFIQKGGKIRIKNRLKTFRKNPDNSSEYKYILTFYNLEKKDTWEVEAKDIILGMPKRSLELLDQDNFFFNIDTQQKLHNNMNSVTPEPSFKILLGFEDPWWEKGLGAKAGESITDLPMRQCYYFGVDPKNSHSLFLASYNDMRTVSFWQALEKGEKFQTTETRLVRAKNTIYPNYEHASKVMVDEVMSQVKELHGPAIEIPNPYTSAFKDWTKDPYGGGYHAWKNNYKVWEVMPYMRHPYKEERIFIAGEAYSDQQGWVEGAFCVAEHIMREKYELECPSWLDQDYYIGW